MSTESEVRKKQNVCVCEKAVLIVYCKCLLVMTFVWILVHSLSWDLRDLSKTFLLLQPYTHYNRAETAVLVSHMQWTDKLVMHSKNMRRVIKTKLGWLQCTLTCQALLVPLMNVPEASIHLPSSAKKPSLMDYQLNH